MSRDASATAAVRATARLAWFAALALLVCVAVAGLHDRAGGIGEAPRVECCEAGGVGRPAVAAAATAAPVRAAAAAAAHAARPRPRTRDGQRRGLPPARAPTC